MMHNATSSTGSKRNTCYPLDSQGISPVRDNQKYCPGFQGRTITSSVYEGHDVRPSVAAEHSDDVFFETLSSKPDISNRTCTQRIDGHLGKHFGILSRLINGESRQSDYVEFYRLDLITLIEFLQKNNIKWREIPRGIVDVIRASGIYLKRLSLIPEDLLTEEFCFLAVKANVKMFECIPDKFKSTRILKFVLQQQPKYIQYVPVYSFTEELVRIALDNTIFPLIHNIPEEVKTQKLLSLIKKHDDKTQYPCDLKLAYELPDSLTEEACFNACAEEGRELEFVPDKLKSERVCRKACETYSAAPINFPIERMTEELAYIAVTNYAAFINKIPARLKTERICLAAIRGNPCLLGSIPVEAITAEHVAIVIRNKDYISYLHIPDKHRSPEIDQETLSHLREDLSVLKDRPVVAERLIRLLSSNAQKDTGCSNIQRVCLLLDLLPLVHSSTASDFRESINDLAQRVILQCDRATFSFKEFLSWIQSPHLTKEFKHKCLNHFHYFEQSFDIKRTSHHNLINLSNPLNGEYLKNHALRELCELSGHIPLFRMPEQEAGDLLVESIEQAIEISGFETLEEHHYQKINDSSAFCDGRTVRVKTDNGVFHYKLHRRNEDPAELARESVIHRYLAEGKARELGLKSEIPVSQQLFKLSLKQLPGSHVEQLEALEIHTDDNNKPYVYGYCYRTGSMSYGTYAWKPDPTNPKSRYSQAEDGMLIACHDLGRWCAMRILHTSILPAYHDNRQGLRWLALHAALGPSSPHHKDVFCGTLYSWNSSATERTDLRYSGLADLVDYERFGEMTSYFSFGDGDLLDKMPMTSQRLALGNYIVEVLVANILIYARLHEDDPEYHFASKTGKKKLKLFIKKAVEAFLNGLTHRQNSPTLAGVLGISEDDCSCWLERTAREILYWTGGVKSTKDGTVRNKRITNFANDLLKEGQLTDKLYEEQVAQNEDREYPGMFHNDNGQITLGNRNKSFPLLSLIQGLTKLSTNIIYLLGTKSR